jgi:cytochrome P450
MTSPIYFDPTDPALRANPYPLYSRMREEDPLHWSPALKSWMVTRYIDVRRVLGDPTLSSDRITPFYKSLPGRMQEQLVDLVQLLGRWLVFRDPPDHGRIRAHMQRAFTPAMMAAVKPNIESVVEYLLDGFKQRDEVDIVCDFALPLPAYVIMDMMGVPRAMLAQMREWSDAIRLFIGTARGVPDKYTRAQVGAQRMGEYFRTLFDARRREPQDDVLTALLRASETDPAYDGDELVATAILFLFGGHETTTNLIGNATLALLRSPGQRARFIGDSALIPTAIEEFLRYDGSSLSMTRIVTTDHEFEGKALKVGDRIYAMQLAANRDPAEFVEPDRCDIGRTPNRHIGFGFGPHFCIGAPLARMEAQIALPALHSRYPMMTALIDEPRWFDSMNMRGMESLPVKLGNRR